MTYEEFEIKADHQLWRELDMNVERFEKMRLTMGEVYRNTFLTQQNRPAGMDYFDRLVSGMHTERIKEMLAARAEGKPVVGTFCVYIPEEVVIALDGICVGLCAGSPASIPDAEKVLPRNICPMVKSAYGFKVANICPYYQAVDLVYGETTCDAKKKTWELLDKLIPTHVMEIPQMKRQRDFAMWREEVDDFVTKMESLAGQKLTSAKLEIAINTVNSKRLALQRLAALRCDPVLPISGRDVLLIEQCSFYDEPIRFTVQVNMLCDELERRIANNNGIADNHTVRIMVSGTPMALPNWKLHNIIENSGATVVNEESCIGSRYYRDIIAAENNDIEEQLAALTRRYMRINCSCFTPNDERMDQVVEEYGQQQAQGVIDYTLQFCHTYNIEAAKLAAVCAKHDIPFMALESDYSPEDIGQLRTRVEAFIEQVAG